MKDSDYYSLLGVPRDADADTIRKAYRKLARRHHPDVSGDAEGEARFKQVGEAYATLKDPARRAAYDAQAAGHAGHGFEAPPGWAGGDGEAGFAGMDLGDVLESLRRGGHGQRRTGPRRGPDYEAALSLSLEEAHRGATLGIDVPHADGSRTLAVTVPAGTTHGQRLRLRGKGGAGVRGGEAGDIDLHVMLRPHPVFRTDGHDLYFDLALAPWEAALGAQVEVPTLDGPVLLTVPAGSRSGRKLRLRGRGLATGHGGRGDLYALVHIDVPAALGDRERELFEELSRVSRFDPRKVAGKDGQHEH